MSCGTQLFSLIANFCTMKSGAEKSSKMIEVPAFSDGIFRLPLTIWITLYHVVAVVSHQPLAVLDFLHHRSHLLCRFR